jgi:hypothetical protein
MKYQELLDLLRYLCCCVDKSIPDPLTSKEKKEISSFENPLFEADDFEIITHDVLYVPAENNS